MNRRNVGIGLVVAALVLAGAALALWLNGSSQVEDDQMTEDFRAAALGRPPEDVEPNRAPPIALGAVSGVLFLAGTIVLVSPSPDS